MVYKLLSSKSLDFCQHYKYSSSSILRIEGFIWKQIWHCVFEIIINVHKLFETSENYTYRALLSRSGLATVVI